MIQRFMTIYSSGDETRVALRRALVLLAIACCAATFVLAQAAPLPVQNKPAEPANPQLGPATPPTAEEAADAVKAPVHLPVMTTAAPVDPKTFVIGPQDILLVRVWKEPELSSAAQVRSDGKITLPLIGEVDASGQTPEGLKEKIAEQLSEYINKPDVIVSVQSVQSRKYYITGETGRPGTFPLVVPTTVLEALTNAGGFKEFANTKKITILRNGKLLKFNYKDVVKGKNSDQNVFLENGDLIVVP